MSKSLHALAAGLLVIPALSLTVTASAAATRCKGVHGHITSELLTGPECTSPVGLCTRGRFTGDIRGAFVFTATSLTPSADTEQTGVVHYTGDILIRTQRGQISIKDAGAFNALPGSTGDVGAVSTIVAGTGRYAGASGRIRIRGTFTPEDGGDSAYSGEIQLP
jgi:hypothetical protein